MDQPPWHTEGGVPALLRAARRTYGSAIRVALDEAGFTDVPRNGTYLISSLTGSGAPLAAIIAQLGVSKQAAGQLVDTLVLRGYLDRRPDPDDRRRLVITLTERGQVAAAAARAAVEAVDAVVLEAVGAARLADARAVLGAVIDARHRFDPTVDGH